MSDQTDVSLILPKPIPAEKFTRPIMSYLAKASFGRCELVIGSLLVSLEDSH